MLRIFHWLLELTTSKAAGFAAGLLVVKFLPRFFGIQHWYTIGWFSDKIYLKSHIYATLEFCLSVILGAIIADFAALTLKYMLYKPLKKIIFKS